jgi:hypothetical protein
MKNPMREDLQKRIKGDCICTILVTIGIGIVFLLYMINFITTLISTEVNNESPAVIMGNLVRLILILIVFIILSILMNDLRKKGYPFTFKNIIRLRVIAVVTMISAVLPELVMSFAGFFDDTAIFTLTFTLANAVLLLLGVVFGIVSEVFKYGYELQTEMDSIA